MINIRVRTVKTGKRVTGRSAVAGIDRATKKAVEELGSIVKKRAKENAIRSISNSRPYNRPHRGGNAEDKSYFDSFYTNVTGTRLRWKAEVGNTAKNMIIEEEGKRSNTKRPNVKRPSMFRILSGWAKDRGLQGSFKELKQRRSKGGQFVKKKALSLKQIVYLVAKAIGKHPRIGNFALQRAVFSVNPDKVVMDHLDKEL